MSIPIRGREGLCIYSIYYLVFPLLHTVGNYPHHIPHQPHQPNSSDII